MFTKLAAPFIGFLVFCLPLNGRAAVGAAAFKNYSADIETTTPKGTFTSKIFSKEGKQRIERIGRAKEGITIVRPDKKVVWMLMPDKKIYMEMPLDRQKQDIASQLQDPGIKTEKEYIGDDTVDGHPAKKYHVTIIRNGTREKSGYLWEAVDMDGFPVKYESEDKASTTVWKNITRGSVADSQFEIPSGYSKMDVPAPGLISPGIRPR